MLNLLTQETIKAKNIWERNSPMEISYKNEYVAQKIPKIDLVVLMLDHGVNLQKKVLIHWRFLSWCIWVVDATFKCKHCSWEMVGWLASLIIGEWVWEPYGEVLANHYSHRWDMWSNTCLKKVWQFIVNETTCKNLDLGVW
jgi:hypothetical protein